MATYVLVHGAWHGGWCWRDVAERLRAYGHTVHTPTLTGLGERAHLLTRAVDLDTHVRDVVAVLEYEDLTEATLVMHSYAGMLLPAIAHEAGDRIARYAVIDGFLPLTGEIAVELLPERAAAHYRDSAAERGEGWWIPPRPMANLGVRDEEVISRVTPKLTPHPLSTYLEPARIGLDDVAVQGWFALCSGWASPFARFRATAVHFGWQVDELPADHEVMLTDPPALADYLNRLSRTAPAVRSTPDVTEAAS